MDGSVVEVETFRINRISTLTGEETPTEGLVACQETISSYRTSLSAKFA